ncbi:MAG: molybdenum cofactor guanylyltransferase [Acidimicrobiales bacterium]
MTAGEGAPPKAAFTGAVLCGGSSTRMGRDKALIEVDGLAMARRVADALVAAGAAPEVLAIGGDATALHALGLTAVPDDHPGAGPLPATVTALHRATHDLVLVVACDLIRPHPQSMARTIEALRRDPDALGAVPLIEGHHQWTHAAWRRSAMGPLAAAFEGGARSLHQAAAALPLASLASLDGLDPDAFVDADAPEHLSED